MICRVTHVGCEAWLHKIYAGISENQINRLENNIPVLIPEDYRAFLEICNGINIFSDSLYIFGLRHSCWKIQPYNIIDSNVSRPKNCPDSWLYFGGYSWDGKMVMFDLSEGTQNNKVYLCEVDSIEILHQWNSLWDWLLDETERISKLFDSNGVEYDEIQTCPIFILYR